MRAIEFVKKHGIKEAIKVVELHPVSRLINIGGSCVSVLDLKQIVDAYELIESLGGMDMAKDIFDIEIHEPHYNYDAEKVTRIEQAINLVEKCNA